MCTVYNVHNHHRYTHTWIHLDQSWDSKKKLKRLELKRTSLLFAGLLTSLQSTIIVNKYSPFESLFIKRLENWRKNENKKALKSERNTANERNIRSDVPRIIWMVWIRNGKSEWILYFYWEWTRARMNYCCMAQSKPIKRFSC